MNKIIVFLVFQKILVFSPKIKLKFNLNQFYWNQVKSKKKYDLKIYLIVFVVFGFYNYFLFEFQKLFIILETF